MHKSTNNGDSPFLSDINMIPLIDIALVLLIIFMIITPYMVLNSIRVNLPRSATAEQQQANDTLTVTIKQDGSVYLNNAPVKAGQITATVKGIAVKKLRGAVIFAERTVSIATVVDVIDQVKAGGVENISLTTERKRQEASSENPESPPAPEPAPASAPTTAPTQ